MAILYKNGLLSPSWMTWRSHCEKTRFFARERKINNRWMVHKCTGENSYFLLLAGEMMGGFTIFSRLKKNRTALACCCCCMRIVNIQRSGAHFAKKIKSFFFLFHGRLKAFCVGKERTKVFFGDSFVPLFFWSKNFLFNLQPPCFCSTFGSVPRLPFPLVISSPDRWHADESNSKQ